MTDWMNDLENELVSMAPKQSSRDLIAAALCAHRDSQVLTAKQLSRELSADELETAFDALDEKYPGLISKKASDGASLAVAFVRTPTVPTMTEQPVTAATTKPNRNWITRLTMVAALLLCFAGGIAIGLRSGGEPGLTIATSEPTPPNGATTEITTPIVTGNKVRPKEQTDKAVAPRPGIRRVPFGRPRSSLTDLAREYHRNRNLSVLQTSL